MDKKYYYVLKIGGEKKGYIEAKGEINFWSLGVTKNLEIISLEEITNLEEIDKLFSRTGSVNSSPGKDAK